MRLISTKILREFWEKHPDSKDALQAWANAVAEANWGQPADIKRAYQSASILKNRRIVFNIHGNRYRLIVAIAYQSGIVFVKFIGTHAACDAVNTETVETQTRSTR